MPARLVVLTIEASLLNRETGAWRQLSIPFWFTPTEKVRVLIVDVLKVCDVDALTDAAEQVGVLGNQQLGRLHAHDGLVIHADGCRINLRDEEATNMFTIIKYPQVDALFPIPSGPTSWQLH